MALAWQAAPTRVLRYADVGRVTYLEASETHPVFSLDTPSMTGMRAVQAGAGHFGGDVVGVGFGGSEGEGGDHLTLLSTLPSLMIPTPTLFALPSNPTHTVMAPPGPLQPVWTRSAPTQLSL